MKINASIQNAEALRDMGGNEGAAIQRKIQSLKSKLGELEKKDELSREEAKKKKELEQQIAELEQKLQQIKADKTVEKTDFPDKESDAFEQLKEDGKGENVDEKV